MTNFRNFKFYSGNRYLILVSIETFKKTASGKSWKARPAEVENRIYDDEHYTNYISSIPFFNNFGEGSYCRGHYGYTCAGYLPIEVNTVSPYREVKKRARFKFIHKEDVTKYAGFREVDILEHATRWNYFDAPERYRYIEFLAKDKSAVFDTVSKKWVN